MLVNVDIISLDTSVYLVDFVYLAATQIRGKLKQMLQYWGSLALCKVLKSSDPEFKPHSDHKPGLFLVAIRSSHLAVPVLKSIGLLPSS